MTHGTDEKQASHETPPAGGFGYGGDPAPAPFGPVIPPSPHVPSAAYAYWTLGVGVFSLIGLAICFIGFPFSIGAIAMGLHHAKRCRRYPDLYTGRGLAIAGAVCGGASLAATMLILASCFFFWNA